MHGGDALLTTTWKARGPRSLRGAGWRWLTGQHRQAGLTRLLVSFGLVAVIWELVARTLVTNRLILVPLSEVMTALVKEAANGALWVHTRVTLTELAIAFPLAVLGGIATGLLLASSRSLQQVLDPLLTAMYSVPVVAVAPLFISWIGLGIESKVAIVLLVSIFPIIINTEVGLRSTEPILVEAARSFGATRWQVFWTVMLPFSVPYILGGIRVAFARALVGVIVAEFFGAVAGYGYAILAASQTFNTALLLGYVVILAMVGMLGSMALRAWERRLAPWREPGDG